MRPAFLSVLVATPIAGGVALVPETILPFLRCQLLERLIKLLELYLMRMWLARLRVAGAAALSCEYRLCLAGHVSFENGSFYLGVGFPLAVSRTRR